MCVHSNSFQELNSLTVNSIKKKKKNRERERQDPDTEIFGRWKYQIQMSLKQR
jgi:hypothetical protein